MAPPVAGEAFARKRRAAAYPSLPQSRPEPHSLSSRPRLGLPFIPRPRFQGLLLLACLLGGSVLLAAQDDVEASIRKAVEEGKRSVLLPPGEHVLERAIVIPEQVSRLEITGDPTGTTLRLAGNFQGKAAIVINGAKDVKLAGFRIDGNRDRLAKPAGLPPSDVTFFDFYSAGGIAADNARDLTLEDVTFENVAGYSVLIARSRRVTLESLKVHDCGSRNGKGRNNATGGILLEEGTTQFNVRNCDVRQVLGNGVWTHSNYGSQRNADGVIENNHFEDIGRDAIQVGHATRVRVMGNTGLRIGYPFDAVDVEGGGIPVGIDTAGNVDMTVYSGNSFQELNGKCIDLDGFHHGEVLSNSCVNRGKAADYPNGHYGIVFNNSNPDMKSREVRVAGNVIYGAKFGGIFLIGEDHVITDNQILRVNQAGCPATHAQFGCLYNKDEPDILSAGIYLGKGAERPDPARHNLIGGNVITGIGMSKRCVVAAPGVKTSDNTIEDNDCMGEPPVEQK